MKERHGRSLNRALKGRLGHYTRPEGRARPLGRVPWPSPPFRAGTKSRTHQFLFLLLFLLPVLSCRRSVRPPVRPVGYDPAHDLGPLFRQVHMSASFPDSKTFVDARPIMDPAEVVQHFDGSNLKDFVQKHFELPRPVAEGFKTDPSQTMEQQIAALWPVLTRHPDSADPRSSLIPLPHPYV